MGPESNLAQAYVTNGGFGEKSVTMSTRSIRPVRKIYAATHAASGSPPRPDVKYSIEYSIDENKSWKPMVSDWLVPRRGDEPGDFWSQSFCYGSTNVDIPAQTDLHVRFRNTGGKRFLRAEMQLVEQIAPSDPVKVTWHWTESDGERLESHVFTSNADWQLATGADVRTHWVEFQPVH